MLSLARLLPLALAGWLLAWSGAQAASAACQGADGYGFVCGLENAEDLVLVPGTSWIIASSMTAGETAIYLVDAKEKTGSSLYSAATGRTAQNMTLYAACPGAPDADNFFTHGLTLRQGSNGGLTLYAVGHGEREAIEVFAVDNTTGRPELTWIGCVPMPDGLEANSVAAFSDGSLLATVLVLPGKSFDDVVARKPTGAVYQWAPGDDGFTLIAGTELPGNNGIEVSADEREFFVVSSGLNTIVAFSRSNPARLLRSTAELPITPDNVHRDSNGRLITAGMINDDPVCGNMNTMVHFDIEAIASCPRSFIASAIDPLSMQVTNIATGPANADFSNATMALVVDDELWIGTFSGNRLAYRSVK
ncbi:MAG: SMP-30/gluconolactonase/LRE family protein [Pseudomonadales bacterium]|nr:SMP-30/gluconolactonase/LRE family protein [Pseudomonadales bacterium]